MHCVPQQALCVLAMPILALFLAALLFPVILVPTLFYLDKGMPEHLIMEEGSGALPVPPGLCCP